MRITLIIFIILFLVVIANAYSSKDYEVSLFQKPNDVCILEIQFKNVQHERTIPECSKRLNTPEDNIKSEQWVNEIVRNHRND